MEMSAFLAYIVLVAGLLMIGDRVGVYIGGLMSRRTGRSPVCNLPAWMDYSIALIIPGVVLFGIMAAAFYTHDRLLIVGMADNMETAIAVAFLCTGLVGGFFSRIRKR